MKYKKTVTATFLEAYSNNEGLIIAPLQKAIEILRVNPNLNGIVCTGTVIAHDPRKKLGEEIVFKDKYTGRTVIFPVPENSEKGTSFLMDSGTYQLLVEGKELRFQPTSTFDTIQDWGGIGFKVSAQRGYNLAEIVKNMRLRLREGNYVGPLFIGGGTYGLGTASATPSMFDRHSILLVSGQTIENAVETEPVVTAVAEAQVEAAPKSIEPPTTRLEIATPYSNLQHLMNSAQRSLELVPSNSLLVSDVSLVKFLKILRNAKVIEKFMPAVTLPCSEDDYLKAAAEAKVIIELPLDHLDYEGLKANAKIGSSRFKGRLRKPFETLFDLL